MTGVPDGYTPSEEQQSIIAHYNAKKYKSVRVTAFNKHIKQDMDVRFAKHPHIEVYTNHGLGLFCLKQYTGNRRPTIDSWKSRKIFEQLYGTVDSAVDKRKHLQHMRDTADAVSLCKLTLTGSLIESLGEWTVTPKELQVLFDTYGVECEASPGMIDAVLRQSSTEQDWIDYDDMVFLPAAHGYTPPKVQLAICDEWQDLNRAQQWLLQHSSDRRIGIGDVHQAIYGFAGADPLSISRMVELLSDEPNGCITLPLTETRRCSQVAVARANVYVPQLRAHSSNPVGEDRVIAEDKLTAMLKDFYINKISTMVLCRTNAPLARVAFSCMRAKVPIKIKGKKFAERIIKIITSFGTERVTELLDKLDEYYSDEQTRLLKSKAMNRDEQLEELSDRCETIRVFCEDTKFTHEVINNIQLLFSDEVRKDAPFLTSVHGSKGLEATEVIIIKPELLPHPKLSAKSKFQATQEKNLAYIAPTRSKLNITTVQTAEKE